jgi:hypothetical protein
MEVNMRIIDKHKDYYDRFAGIYGIDNTIIYDRRGSKLLTQSRLIRRMYSENHDLRLKMPKDKNKSYPDVKLFGILEAGYRQYLIMAYNLSIKVNPAYIDRFDRELIVDPIFDANLEVIRVFDEHKHNYSCPLNFYGIELGYVNRYLKSRDRNILYNISQSDLRVCEKDRVIENPILINTKVPGIIEPERLYWDIFDYISGEKDVTVKDTRTDLAKVIDHGFDKITSFRNM